MLTLIRPAAPVDVVSAPPGVVLRPPSADDIVALGRLYFASYGPGIASVSEHEAIADIRASFDGRYGALNRASVGWRVRATS